MTGRLTWSRAILAGMGQGAWFGVFVGLLLSILSTSSWFNSMVWGIVWGALLWGTFAAIDYYRTAGRRDFTSLSVTVPQQFEVLVVAGHDEPARQILAPPAG